MDTYSPEENFILQILKKELSPDLTYHGLHHTHDVLNAAMIIAAHEKINADDLKLLRIGVLFHDSGFINTYKNHEESGCELVLKYLPGFGYTKKELDIICNLIMATKIPQSAKTTLEKIICDADLDYLGRDDFHKISNSLYQEVKAFSFLQDKNEWNKIQKFFLEHHSYYTEFGKKNREPGKRKYLKEICELISEED